ncbi:sporulation integral membrane protein YtvI [Brevibacillus sp. SYP-B805]|uniref:sporulation integral membrane protein YtvI n=1 Tax=Brevibacillus sp. SYP-B805 TaxID=1578199 RepID=UPI0013EB3E19|nr:sporulation integral membrane protein YtvI [Brevibacillus sp. SYP-B805]NGQ94844.1 sporulation integral membrane protein YtvI [Brevibacillus sp. SYP-B805]
MSSDNWLARHFQIVRFLWVCVILYIGYRVFLFATPLLYPFFISLLIALMINRPVAYLQQKARLPRWLAVLLLLALLLAVLGGLITLAITETVIEIGHLIDRLSPIANEFADYLQQTISQDFVTGLYNQVKYFYNQLDPAYKENIDAYVGNAIRTVTAAGKELVVGFLAGLQNFLLSLPNLATVLVISLLGAFFISKDYDLWNRRFRRLLPKHYSSRIDQIALDLRNALFGFVKAQLTLISLTAAIVIVGLLILRVDFAVTIGLITGLVDLLPYLGTGTVFVPWIVYAFFKGNYSLVIGLSILYGIVVIFRQIVEPKVVAENVGLDPLLTLVALFVGLQLFGFFGLIVGPVSLVVINALVRANVLADLWAYIKKTPPT